MKLYSRESENSLGTEDVAFNVNRIPIDAFKCYKVFNLVFFVYHSLGKWLKHLRITDNYHQIRGDVNGHCEFVSVQIMGQPKERSLLVMFYLCISQENHVRLL